MPLEANESYFANFLGHEPTAEAKAEPAPKTERPARAAGPRRSEAKRHLVATPASEIKMERTEWLWGGRIPLGEVTLLAGMPGLGKSMLTARLAAENSLGLLTGEPGATLIATAEDSPERTVVPRLKAWEADLRVVRFVHVVEGGEGEDLPESISLPRDTDTLRETVEKTKTNLLVIDPLMAHLDAAVDSHRDQAVRGALNPLYFLARDHGCAVVVLLHLNKNAGSNPLLRIGGSMGLPAAARSALLLARDPDDPDGEQGSRRILAHTKCNVGPEAPSLQFEIEPILIPATDTEPDVETARIELLGESDLTGTDLLSGATGNDEEKTSRLAEAEQFLRSALADGPRSSRDVKRAAEEAGVTPKTLRRARESLGVTDRREASGHTTWQLPPEAHAPRAQGAGARSTEGAGGHEAPRPAPDAFVPLRAHRDTKPFVPTPSDGHEAGTETSVRKQSEGQGAGTESVPAHLGANEQQVLADLADIGAREVPQERATGGDPT